MRSPSRSSSHPLRGVVWNAPCGAPSWRASGYFPWLTASHNPAMSSREERISKNGAVSPEINDRVKEAHQLDPPGRRFQIACECVLKPGLLVVAAR